MKTIPVTVATNQEIAPGCFRMVLCGRLEAISFKPGQFIMLRLGSGCDPLLGRPFAAYHVGNGRRDSVELCYKVVGRGTRMMSRMRPGQELSLWGPLGNGFSIPQNTRTVYIVAGGMGVVPVRGLIEYLIDASVAEIHLFLGAKTAAHLLFYERFQELNIALAVATEDGSAGHHGLVTDLFGQWLATYDAVDKAGAICCACGPAPMLKTIAGIVARFRIPCQVSLEARMACGIGACLGCVVALKNGCGHSGVSGAYGRVCLEGPIFEAKDIAW